MNNLFKANGKITWLLLFGILLLCGGFILVSCGSGGAGGNSSKKVIDPNAGIFAVDFSNCPGSRCNVTEAKDFSTKPMANRALTIESWVKVHSTSTSGGIFGRMVSSGIMLFANTTSPTTVKAVIRREKITTGFDDYVVSPTSTTLTVDKWYHVAAVLTDQDHSLGSGHASAHAACSDGSGAESGHHVDLYIGDETSPSTWVDCADVGGALLTTEPGNNEVTAGIVTGGDIQDNPIVEAVPTSAPFSFNGAVDESRLWGVERTAAQIAACWKSRLDLNNGVCTGDSSGVGNFLRDDVYVNFRYNEGTGVSSFDTAGGPGAVKTYNGTVDWPAGWIPGVL